MFTRGAFLEDVYEGWFLSVYENYSSYEASCPSFLREVRREIRWSRARENIKLWIFNPDVDSGAVAAGFSVEGVVVPDFIEDGYERGVIGREDDFKFFGGDEKGVVTDWWFGFGEGEGGAGGFDGVDERGAGDGIWSDLELWGASARGGG